MSKTVSKDIMKRTKPRNYFLKNRTEKNGEKPLCIIINKNKAKLYNSVNEKNITDNRKFSKTFKPML